jgi:amino acid adenylation domain-containing protein
MTVMDEMRLSGGNGPGSGRPPVTRRGAGPADLPMSFAQEQLWFIDEFHKGLPAHNMPSLVWLRGQLDVPALGRALDGVVARHEALRTRLLAGPGGRPVQMVDPPAAVKLDLTDYAELGPDAASGQLRELAIGEALRRFHLAADQPLRAHLVRLAVSEHVLVVVVHRAVIDHWSLRVLLAELAALYGAEAAGTGPGLAEPPAGFADYALWERRHLRGTWLAGLQDYWRGALAGFETTQFPTDRPRPVFANHDGAVAVTVTSRELLAGLRELGRREDTTLEVILLAALHVLLHRYTGQTDLVVGAVSASRTAPELAPVIGFLANTLPVRADLSGDPAFTELLARVRAATEGALAHQDLPFAKVVDALGIERDTSRFPIYQVVFAFQEPPGDTESAGVVFHAGHAELPASMYDICLVAEPGGDGLRLETTYATALFDGGTVGRLLGHFEVLLRGVVADPGARLSELPVLTGQELHRELVAWNDTAAQFPAVCIHEGFQAQVARAPGAVAAQFEGERLSYAELNRQANQIARRLRAAGAGPEVLVGVCMQTGLRRLAVLLGVLKAGAGYVPLDPALPADRLSFMLADTQMPVVVADNASAGSVPRGGTLTVVAVDTEWAQIRRLDGGDLTGTGVTRSNVAYVIYTSGSTGQPKGVVVEHRQAINFLQGMIGAWRIGPSSAVLQFAAFTFDVSVMDMFMPLLGGARVILAPAAALHSPPRLAALMRECEVTFACLPPAVLNLLTGQDFPGLRTLLSAGEELSSDLLRAWLRDGLEIYNGYGPTEASIGATFMKLDSQTQLPPPIGRPKPNYRAYVLDTHLNPVPVGVTGELHIGGAGVARGYLNRPELTRQRFIADPFTPGQRLYKTGDLVRRRGDGTIVFAGRIDDQVKIRGLRVEPGEIEAALLTHPAIAQAVVTVITDHTGDKQLAAYLRPQPATTSPATTLLTASIRQHLARHLPAYMIPAYLTTLDKLPLTSNGKINKTALPPPQTQSPAEQAPPATLIETMVVALYGSVLGTEQVGATDSFFDIGGSSLQAMRLVRMLDEELAVKIGVAAVFLAPTPRQLAALLRDEHGLEDAELGADGIDGLDELPLTGGQAPPWPGPVTAKAGTGHTLGHVARGDTPGSDRTE